MATKSETSIVQNIIKQAKEEWRFDGYHVHGSSMQRAFEPDIDGSVFSHELRSFIHIKIEVKTPIGTPTIGQLIRLRNYHHRNYLVGIVTSYAEFVELIHTYEAWAGATNMSGLFFTHQFKDVYMSRGNEDNYELY